MTESEGDTMESQDIEMNTVNNDDLKTNHYATDTYDNDGGNNDHDMNTYAEGDDGSKGHDASDSGAISTGDDSQNDDCDVTPRTNTYAHDDTNKSQNNTHDDTPQNNPPQGAKSDDEPMPEAPSDDKDDNPQNVHVIDDDLEEGECSDDEEEAPPPPAPEPPREVIPPRDERKEKSSKEKKHKHRDRSRDRHKSKKHRNRDRHHSQDQEQEGEMDEEGKKRSLLSKLKALEGEMGILDDYGDDMDEMSGIYAEGQSPRGSSEEARSSRSRSTSPVGKSKKKRKRNDKTRERKRRRHERKNERIEGKDEICGLYMQGKCPKAASDCLYSHDAEPPQVWELCKFYLFDRCAKKEKCLYLHKGFPCKYYHTGKRCLDTKESCKFSHENLNDMTRALLLKHIESAPKEILGDFPRMSREAAAAAIFNTEAKHKGWITEGPNAVPPPVLDPNPYDSPPRDEDEEESMGMQNQDIMAMQRQEQMGMSRQDNMGNPNQEPMGMSRQEVPLRQDFQPPFDESVKMPNHMKLNSIQEKLLAQSYGNSTGSGGEDGPQLGQKLSRWEEPDQKPQGFGSRDLDQKQQGFGSRDMDQKPQGFGSRDMDQKPQGFGSRDMDQKPQGFGSRDMDQKPQGFGSRDMDQKPQGFGSRDMDQQPQGFGSRDMDQKPQGFGSSFPPLAVQQAMALSGGRGAPMGQMDQMGPQQGPVGHGVRNNGAFNQGPVRRQTVGLLGPPPTLQGQGQPSVQVQGPTDLMKIQVNEREVQQFLDTQRSMTERGREEDEESSGRGSDDMGGGFEVDPWNKGDGSHGGDDTPEVTPPVSRSGTPTPDTNMDFSEVKKEKVLPKLPKAQQMLYERIQKTQKERKISQDTVPEDNNDNRDDDWYSDEEEDNKNVLSSVLKKLDSPNSFNEETKENKDRNSPQLEAPFNVNNLNLPKVLTNVLTAISKGGSGNQSPLAEENKNRVSPGERKSSKRSDPRLSRPDPRKEKKMNAEETEREKDKRLFEMDLGSVFGDLELPPLVSSPKRTDQEKTMRDSMNLPFKPHIVMAAATEIDAGITSHSPIDFILRPIHVSKPDYSDIKHHFTPTQLEADPRLRRFAKSGMAKMKDLPLPEFPVPKAAQDPRIKARTEQRSGDGRLDPRSDPRLRERRTSSTSDESDGQVYNPQKELSRSRRDDRKKMEPYSPSQGYTSPHDYDSPRTKPEFTSPRREDVYNPAKELMSSRPPRGVPPPSAPVPPPGPPPLNQPPPGMMGGQIHPPGVPQHWIQQQEQMHQQDHRFPHQQGPPPPFGQGHPGNGHYNDRGFFGGPMDRGRGGQMDRGRGGHHMDRGMGGPHFEGARPGSMDRGRPGSMERGRPGSMDGSPHDNYYEGPPHDGWSGHQNMGGRVGDMGGRGGDMGGRGGQNKRDPRRRD